MLNALLADSGADSTSLTATNSRIISSFGMGKLGFMPAGVHSINAGGVGKTMLTAAGTITLEFIRVFQSAIASDELPPP